MQLYVCYGTWRFAPYRKNGHPCGRAHHALKEAGHRPEVVRSYGLGLLGEVFNQTRGRRDVKRLTGNYWVPVLITDEGDVIQGSEKIVAWARANPAGAATAPAAQNEAASRSAGDA